MAVRLRSSRALAVLLVAAAMAQAGGPDTLVTVVFTGKGPLGVAFRKGITPLTIRHVSAETLIASQSQLRPGMQLVAVSEKDTLKDLAYDESIALLRCATHMHRSMGAIHVYWRCDRTAPRPLSLRFAQPARPGGSILKAKGYEKPVASPGSVTPGVDTETDAGAALQEGIALHQAAVEAEGATDPARAEQLYLQALRRRPIQWESALRLGTLRLQAERLDEAEAALRYTVQLSRQRDGVDLCAARSNLGVILASRATADSGSDTASTEPGAEQQRASWAAEALVEYELAASESLPKYCTAARLNAAKLLEDAAVWDTEIIREAAINQNALTAKRPAPMLTRTLAEVSTALKGVTGPSDVVTAAAAQYAAAIDEALNMRDIETATAAAVGFHLLLRSQGSFGTDNDPVNGVGGSLESSPGSEQRDAPWKGVRNGLNAGQHAMVGRAALNYHHRSGQRKGVGNTDGRDLRAAELHTAAALQIDPAHHLAALNVGLLAEGRGRLEEATAAYQRAALLAGEPSQQLPQPSTDLAHKLDSSSRLHPDEGAAVSASNNLGNVLQTMGRWAEGLAAYEAALTLQPTHVEAWNNRGVALIAGGRLEEAVTSYSTAMQLRPGFVQALGGLMHAKTCLCDWRDRPSQLYTLSDATRRHLMGTGPPALLPQQALCYPLPSHLPRAIAELHAHQIRRTALQQHMLRTHQSFDGGSKVPPRVDGVLRFCYVSVTFDSAMGSKWLETGRFSLGGGGGVDMKGVFGHHNRSRVEVVAFSLSSTDSVGSKPAVPPWQNQFALPIGADYFVSLANHAEPAVEMRRWSCSVAFHLDGHSSHARPEFFVRTERQSPDERHSDEDIADDDGAREWDGAAAGAAAALNGADRGTGDKNDEILTMGGATAFAVAAASSSAELAAFAAAAATWQTRFAPYSPQPAIARGADANHGSGEQQKAETENHDNDSCASSDSDDTGTSGRHCQLTQAMATVALEDENPTQIHTGSSSSSEVENQVRRVEGGIAPLQISIMCQAYPGTMGNAVDFDYAVGDRISSPPELRVTQLSEKLLEMPYSGHFTAEPLLKNTDRVKWRSKDGSGATPVSFVFGSLDTGTGLPCAVDTGILDSWTNILRRCPGAVLWQKRSAVSSGRDRHLSKEVKARGIGGRRYSAVPALDGGPAQVSLGLDTRQCNAQGGAQEFLADSVMPRPYLTVAGGALAQRVAASLAIAHGVPELVTHSEKEYEDVAVDLSSVLAATAAPKGMWSGTVVGKSVGQWRASSNEQLAWLQERVALGRSTDHGRLFDSQGWAAALERKLDEAWDSVISGQRP